MNAQIWRLLGLLLLIIINTSLSIDADCDFKQTLEPGKIYYITNPGYPGRYSGVIACRWHAQSNTKIKLTCSKFNIPSMKIVGGEETGINEYPMMAGIIDVPKQQVFCGGTIISNSHIVSAAHCLINFKSSRDLGILIGDHDLSTGWGTTEYAGTPSQILHKVSVSVTNFLSCKKFYPELEYRQICTFSEGKDACQFDSGGPVLWINPSTRRLTLVGIVSYGTSCASEKPAVNTRVGSFIEFIISSTPGVDYCQAE